MNSTMSEELVENVTYDELHLGQSAQMTRCLTLADIQAFAAVSGDTNPAHMDSAYANDTLFHGVIAHGMWSGALVSALLGTQFPGPGTIYLQQDLHFTRPVRIGDTLLVKVTVTAKDDSNHHVTLDCQIENQKGEAVLQGTARVIAPATKVRRARIPTPLIQLSNPQERLTALLAQGKGLSAVNCAVVHPCDSESLTGAVLAAQYGLITPILVGPEARIRALAEQSNIDLYGLTIVSTPHSHAAAEVAAQLAVDGKVQAMMKGSLHTDELLHAVLAQTALRTERRMSHVYRFDIPTYSKALFVTDAALNVRPSLLEKADIIQNAIDFARILGVERPKVAILAAVETVNPEMPSTVDAAALCKMADRGQIQNGLLDGPLAFDNAISPHAAHIKGIVSPVAGDADILAVPDLEAGNILAKQLEYFAGASGAGLVVGARVPIALTSRSDGVMVRVASALLAQLVAAKGSASARHL